MNQYSHKDRFNALKGIESTKHTFQNQVSITDTLGHIPLHMQVGERIQHNGEVYTLVCIVQYTEGAMRHEIMNCIFISEANMPQYMNGLKKSL